MLWKVVISIFVFIVYSAVPALAQHNFVYDQAKERYVVDGESIDPAFVQRNLAGALCSRCHPNAVDEVRDSVHYTLAGRNARVLFPGGGAHGMMDRACGLPGATALINYTSDVNIGECGKCHVGRFLPAMEGALCGMLAAAGASDPAGEAGKVVDGGIDCLICHAEVYRSVPEGVLAATADHAPGDGRSPSAAGNPRESRDDADFDHDGTPDPVIDIDGDGSADMPLMYDPDGDGIPEPWPTVAQDRSPDAVLSVGATTEHACLRCHEHARTGYKRGVPFTPESDVHAAAATAPFKGARNRCTVCHKVSRHKFVRGHSVGGDLMAADFEPPPSGTPTDPADPTDISCIDCHMPDRLSGAVHAPRHLSAIACETCHIPQTSGITYSLFGHGTHLAFGRNAEGLDTKLIAKDHMISEDAADAAADLSAYRTAPVLMWFDGATSFLAQPLAHRGTPNARITPFKPMANGMVFDARFFSGKYMSNDAGVLYNAHSMYRFYANGVNADLFYSMDMLDLTPDEVRSVSLTGFQSPDPARQAMAMMQVFPNLIHFDKHAFGIEHYLVSHDSPFDSDGDGYIDPETGVCADMYAAANRGLEKFQGFNLPMGLPSGYQWYPQFENPSELVTIKAPDGSLMKMFLQFQAMRLPVESRDGFLSAVENYPAFSNGVTLGGHGVRAKEEALGARSCLDCHGESGALARTVPVTRKVAVNMGEMGTVELPLYRWRYYQVSNLLDLGVKTRCEEVASGTADVDINCEKRYIRESAGSFVLNWFMPDAGDGYRPADDAASLEGTQLKARDITLNGGAWMPVLEPVVTLVPNYAVLGYRCDEVIRTSEFSGENGHAKHK